MDELFIKETVDEMRGFATLEATLREYSMAMPDVFEGNRRMWNLN